MHKADVVIIGGGPAGSTVSALIKRYSPTLRVLLLEKAAFPRHHVGESLLAAGSPVLHEMGAYDKINNHGFVEKLGASYVWGRDRKPWGFEFDKLIAQLVAQGRRLPELYTKGWHVRRAEYDLLLLLTAAERGVEVRTEARVSDVSRDESTGRVTGVTYTDKFGTHTVASSLVLDCSGQDGLLGRKFKLRQYDDRMNNYALWGYWRGARWLKQYVGHPNLARIFVATTPLGWIWYIPVHRNVISVGFVTQRQILEDKLKTSDPERLYLDEIRACPEMHGLLDRAQLVRLSADQRRDVCVIQDWSYDSQRMAGPGWAMVGDAAGFVDPILSSGVMLAHELGQKAAYAVNSTFAASTDAEIAAFWSFYEDTYRTYLRAYRDMAAFWYANNFSMESWWWEARRTLHRDASGVDVSDPEAFMRVASGYANRTESLSLFGSYPLHEATELVDGLFGRDKTRARIEEHFDGRPIRLQPAAKLGDGYYFFRGQLRKTRRVVNTDTAGYVDLHPGEDFLIDLLDGSHTLRDLNRVVDRVRAMDAQVPLRTGTELVVQLDNIGAIGRS
jgi:flavin-dependent dehydrogenase